MSESRGGVSLTRVRAVSRAVAILKAFSRDEPWLPLRKIAALTKLDPGTVRRILITLCDENLVRQDADTARYSLSSGVVSIAHAAPRGNSLSELAAAAMQTLAKNTQSTAFLSILEKTQLRCLSQFSADSAVEVRFAPTDVQSNPEADRTAALNVLLGFDQDNNQSAGLRESLRTELRQIREQGWHLAKDAPVAGLSAIAAPVVLEEQCVAAVSVAGLTPQVIQGDSSSCLVHLRQCRESIEASLLLNPEVEIA